MGPHVEYLGWTPSGIARRYTLRVREPNGDFRDYTVAIANEAFLSRRVRFQDGPEICFLKLHKELVASAGDAPPAHFDVSDEELAAYRLAHVPKPPQRRPKAPPVV